MKKYLFIISLLLCNFLCFAQIDYIEGTWDEYEYTPYNYIPSSGVLDSRNGYWHSPHGQIRFLMAFIELDYSNPNDDPTLNETNSVWPVGQLPVWKDDLLEYNVPTGLSTKHLTKYYQLASSNSLIVLGDYLVAPDNGGMFKVPTNNGEFNVSNAINIINQKLGNSFTTAHGFSSVSYFDLWTITNEGAIKPNTGNNYWDFVVFIIRNSLSPKNLNGNCYHNAQMTLIGHQLDGYAEVCTYKKDPTQIIRHEYAHQLLGGNISTARLLETCLYYPFNIDIFAFDDQLGSFGRVKHQFNGYAELYQGSTLQGFLQSGKLADPADLDYIFNKARTL